MACEHTPIEMCIEYLGMTKHNFVKKILASPTFPRIIYPAFLQAFDRKIDILSRSFNENSVEMCSGVPRPLTVLGSVLCSNISRNMMHCSTIFSKNA